MPNTQGLWRIPEFYFSHITEKVSGHPVLIASKWESVFVISLQRELVLGFLYQKEIKYLI